MAFRTLFTSLKLPLSRSDRKSSYVTSPEVYQGLP